jgi:NitT/TauT family transport system substrate-binding protein
MPLPRREFIAAAAALTFAPKAARAADVVPVKIATTASESASNVLYATELGFFTKNGLDVDLQLLSNSGAYASGIVSGAFDVGSISAGSVVVAHERNLPFLVLANGGIYSDASPTTYLCVVRGSSIRTAADFKGKTIGVSTLGDITQVAVIGWLQRGGVDYHAVNFVELSPFTMLAALKQQRIDGAFIGEPAFTPDLDEVTVLAPAYSTVARRFAIVEWVTSRSWAAANPAVATRVQTALGEASTWAMDNRAQAGAILAKYANLSPSLVQRMHHVDWVPGASASLLQPVINAMAKYGFIAKAFGAEELF